MSKQRTAIVIDNSPRSKALYMESLRKGGFLVDEFVKENAALLHLEDHRPDVAIVHFTQEVRRSLSFISRIAKFDPTIAIIYITYYGDDDLHNEAVSAGAFTVIDKNRTPKEQLPTLFEAALNHSLLLRHHQAMKTAVFVLMPFDKRFDKRYRLGIKQPLESMGLSCLRADEIQFTGNVVAKVLKSIEDSGLIVADMTGMNANVFYEVGYAHALKKTVILVTEGAQDIPFDLRAERHIVYGRSLERLRGGLIKTVTSILNL